MSEPTGGIAKPTDETPELADENTETTDENKERWWEELVAGLMSGDELAYYEFWQRYGRRLDGVARKHFPRGLIRRMEPADLVQSVCRSFFRRATGGKLKLQDADSLWRVLCAITINKMRMKHRFHLAERQSAMREQDVQASDGALSVPRAIEPAANSLGPDEAALFAEQLAAVMQLLDHTEKRMLELKLEGYTHGQIAEQVGRCERTIRRVFKRLQSKLETTYSDSVAAKQQCPL